MPKKMLSSVICLLVTLSFTNAQSLFSSSMDNCGVSGNVNKIVHSIFLKGFVELQKTVNSEMRDLNLNWLRDLKKVMNTVDAFEEHQKRLTESVSEIIANITTSSKATQSLLYFDKIAFQRQLENLSITFRDEKERTNSVMEQLSLLDERTINQSNVFRNIMRDVVDQFRDQEEMMLNNVSVIFGIIRELRAFYSNMEAQFTRSQNNSINDLKEMLEEMIHDKSNESFRRISDLTYNISSSLANTKKEIDKTGTLIQATEDIQLNISKKLESVSDDCSQLKKEISNNKQRDIQYQETLEMMQTEITELKNNMTKGMPSTSCPSDWTSFGSSCYLVIKQKKSWDDAAMKCLRYGAKLVEIETKEENDFLKQRLINTNDNYWTGGIDEVTEGRFVWASTGNPLTFTDWNKGEPNDYRQREDCLDFSKEPSRRKQWNDNRCASAFYFICEKTQTVEF